MSNLFIDGFVNVERPSLEYPSVTELPTSDLDAESLSKLKVSLEVNSADLMACSRSARLWETLLEQTRIPFLLLRVADMRFVLDSKPTALELYEELQTTLQDSALAAWISQTKQDFINEMKKMRAHNAPTNLMFSQSQRWQSSFQHDQTFPYCNIQSQQISDLRERWQKGGIKLQECFFNLHCLETNFLEEIFQLSYHAADQLLENGFANGASLASSDIVKGEMRDPSDTLSILRDTRKALDMVIDIFSKDTGKLTLDIICNIHKTVLSTNRILCIEKSGFTRLKYINSGVTRQRSRVNVIIRSGKTIVQFCPYNEVDQEMNVFCDRFNALIQQEAMDPFAAAAWINHVFTAIHPFEDGNGRVSRLLSSVPLLRKGLPPLCILASQKDSYVRELNKIRSFRNGDYEELMENFYKNTLMSLENLRERNE